MQLAALERARKDLEALGVVPVAIGPGDIEEHQRYVHNRGFGFSILADSDHSVSKAYGAMRPKGLMVIRSVYVIDPESRVFFAERGQSDFEKIVQMIRENTE